MIFNCKTNSFFSDPSALNIFHEVFAESLIMKLLVHVHVYDFQGYAAHITSTVSEWATAFAFLCFFLTFVGDFRKVELNVVTKVNVRHLDESYVTYDDDVNEESRLIA